MLDLRKQTTLADYEMQLQMFEVTMIDYVKCKICGRVNDWKFIRRNDSMDKTETISWDLECACGALAEAIND